MKDHDHKCSQRHVRGDDESGKPEVTNAIKKTEPIDPAFLSRGKNHGLRNPLYRVYF
jgi:hypothetical protein